MATVQEINRISVNSTITIEEVKLNTIVFGDGNLISNDLVKLNDRILNVRKDLEEEVNLYVEKDGLTIYEWKIALDGGNTTLPLYDKNGKKCTGLTATGVEVVLFVDGKKISRTDSYGQANYVVNQNNTITVVVPFTKFTARNPGSVIAYVFTNASYGGKLEDLNSWDKENKLLSLTGYNSDKYIFFLSHKYKTVETYDNLPTSTASEGDTYRVLDTGKVYTFDSYHSEWNQISSFDQLDGQIISPRLLTNSQSYVYFNVDIDDTTSIDYYTLGEETQHYIFDAVPAVYDYGRSDATDKILPILYDRRVTFNESVRNLINNVRQGFFIKEAETGYEGSLMIIDTTFDLPYVNCIKIINFSKDRYTSSQYFVQVPEARSIVNYLSQYDLEKQLLPEVLKVFQRVILDEAYDHVKRLQDTRDITRVDSNSISQLIKFMGVTLNIYNMTTAEKRKLLEELTNFYKRVGTRPSYNIYNQATSHGQMAGLRQLFTPIKDTIGTDSDSTDTSTRRYVTFRTDIELGAQYYRDYVYPYVDYGDISALANSGESLLNKPRSEGKVEVPNREVSQGYPPKMDVEAISQDYSGRYFIPKSNINFYAWKYPTSDVTNANPYRILLTTSPTPQANDLIWVFDTRTQSVIYYPPVTEAIPLIVTSYDENTDTLYIHGAVRNTKNSFGVFVNEPCPRDKVEESGEYTYPNDMTSREVYIMNKDIYYCWKDLEETNYYFTKAPNLVVGQLAYQRTTTDLYNHHNYIASYTPASGTLLAKCTLDNGLTLYRDENDDGYYNGYLESVPVKENPYIVDPIPGPNQVSPGYDYGVLVFYKGEVQSKNDLPLVGNTYGDYFIVITEGTYTEYVWTSESSSGTIDDWVQFEPQTVDYGSVSEEIEGEWVTWYEWDRPESWYPTNHVQVSANVPTNVDYDTFMIEFKNTFYDLASAVLFVHSIERVYNVGSSQNRKNQENSPFSLVSTPVYNTREMTFNNNRSIQPPFKIKRNNEDEEEDDG